MRFHTALKLFALTFVFAFLSAGVVRAQVNTGSISGTTVDQSGASIPGVQVTATNATNGVQAKAVSNGSGDFHLALLPIGAYDLEFSKQGFAVSRVAAVLVSSGA
ncbi:MAG TPA: carboxypeptidase-like regulatory domain-containing protein, partial [Candidatus Acidoferrales bacterium]|nr:carboxypeptidase-like regulatory domain-containing protein [Candidatus Acidoferrales bacterium]